VKLRQFLATILSFSASDSFPIVRSKHSPSCARESPSFTYKCTTNRTPRSAWPAGGGGGTAPPGLSGVWCSLGTGNTGKAKVWEMIGQASR
jgi:hypothetical protein